MNFMADSRMPRGPRRQTLCGRAVVGCGDRRRIVRDGDFPPIVAMDLIITRMEPALKFLKGYHPDCGGRFVIGGEASLV
jgi:hypothetical protein